jgi:hypothetical protein
LLLGENERLVLDQIERHFEHMVPEVTLNDDDTFESILTAAGLMSPDES